jgi:hypothetical protein
VNFFSILPEFSVFLQQLEPVMGDPASSPFNYTKGLEYVGYGELYLDILAAATSKDQTQHNKFDFLYGQT